MKITLSALAIALAATVCTTPLALAQTNATTDQKASPVRVFLNLDGLSAAIPTPTDLPLRAKRDIDQRASALKAKRDRLVALSNKIENGRETLTPAEVQTLTADANALGDEIQSEASQLSVDTEIARSAVKNDLFARISSSIEVYLAANPSIDVLETISPEDAYIVVSDDYDITAEIAKMLETNGVAPAGNGPQHPAVVRYVDLTLVAYEAGVLDKIDTEIRAFDAMTARELNKIQDEIRTLVQSITLNDSDEDIQHKTKLGEKLQQDKITKTEQRTLQVASIRSERYAAFRNEINALVPTAPELSGIDLLYVMQVPGQLAGRRYQFAHDEFNVTDAVTAAYKRAHPQAAE